MSMAAMVHPTFRPYECPTSNTRPPMVFSCLNVSMASRRIFACSVMERRRWLSSALAPTPGRSGAQARYPAELARFRSDSPGAFCASKYPACIPAPWMATMSARGSSWTGAATSPDRWILPTATSTSSTRGPGVGRRGDAPSIVKACS